MRASDTCFLVTDPDDSCAVEDLVQELTLLGAIERFTRLSGEEDPAIRADWDDALRDARARILAQRLSDWAREHPELDGTKAARVALFDEGGELIHEGRLP